MKLFISTCLSIVVLAVMAQANEEFDEKVYFADAEYFFIQEFYVDALHDFLEVYNHGYEENANLNYLIGICYLNIPGQKSRSIEHFLKAEPYVSDEFKKSSLKEVHAPKDLFLYLGNAYRINNELDKAINSYRRYQGMVGEENEFEHSFAEQQVLACETAKKLIDKPVGVFMNNIGAPINDNYPNFRPVLTKDENTLIFMTQLPFYDAIFVSNKANGNWQSPVNITPELQSDGDQYVCDISDDGSMLLLTREEDLNSDIYISYQKDGIWSKSEPISEINTRFWESHACFSADGKTIYFASNKVGGQGGMDIYVSTLDDEGEWSEPVNMGAPVNSPMNEDFPFITSDNKRLYYSSQQNPIMGGFDVFYCKMENDSWNGPFNMGYPINSTDDDIFYFPVNNGESAYVYRYDENGEGDYDIFRIGGLALEAEAVKGEIPVLEDLIDKAQLTERELLSEKGTPILLEDSTALLLEKEK
ncbi:MAG: hypothetical protein MI922_00385, partial [Bacteroidales bacterium]|nr:hypothetical protein [Bacteroidales bacterium]